MWIGKEEWIAAKARIEFLEKEVKNLDRQITTLSDFYERREEETQDRLKAVSDSVERETRLWLVGEGESSSGIHSLGDVTIRDAICTIAKHLGLKLSVRLRGANETVVTKEEPNV